MEYALSIPESPFPRVVIAGGGFGGLQLAKSLKNKPFQVVLIDKNNFHQFQPLFYQVAMSGLEPSSIVFPFRKIFQKAKNVHFRMTEILEVIPQKNTLITANGIVTYDYLVLAMGADTNYFGNPEIMAEAVPMKSVSEALFLRNTLLEKLETLSNQNPNAHLDLVVVGGGPTGVEIAGMLAEMKNTVFPKDYPEMDFTGMNIHLVQGMNRVLNTFSEESSRKAQKYLEKLGVTVHVDTLVQGAKEGVLKTSKNEIPYHLLIWAAGIKANGLKGLEEGSMGQGGRLLTHRNLKSLKHENIFAIGDQAMVVNDPAFPQGHPQVAQTAIQGAMYLSKLFQGKAEEHFRYKDLGSMATVGRNLAVVELKLIRFGGWFAWITWMFVHLMSIVGVKNRLFIFINWLWNYITYDQSLRLLIKPFRKEELQEKTLPKPSSNL